MKSTSCDPPRACDKLTQKIDADDLRYDSIYDKLQFRAPKSQEIASFICRTEQKKTEQ